MSEGKKVDPTPAETPTIGDIQGRYVKLERFTEAHIPGLWHHYTVDESTFALLPGDTPADQEVFGDVLREIEREGNCILVMMANPNRLVPGQDFNEGREPLGVVVFGDVNKPNRVAEFGAIMGPAVRRSAASTEAHFLLLKELFDPPNGPGFRRVAWKTSSFNKASQKTAERLGYVYEGRWRNHMIVKGRSRDSLWYSMIDDDWPAIRKAFEAWLDLSNFDGDGNQKRRLEDLRNSFKNASDE